MRKEQEFLRREIERNARTRRAMAPGIDLQVLDVQLLQIVLSRR